MAIEIAVTSNPAGFYAGPVEAISYTYSEESSPLSGGDSSGSVGTFTITMPLVDPSVGVPTSNSVYSKWAKYGDTILHGATVSIKDSRKGLTTGIVNQVERSPSQGTVTLSGTTRMSLMNVFNVQAQPYSGTLVGAITYYMSLAGITSGFTVAASIANTPVTIPGWFGELWLHIKQLVAANACDISLVSNIIQVRPLRQRVATRGRDISRSNSAGGYNLAQAVEVYQYSNRAITNQMVYPTGTPSLEDQVLNVNAGETAEFTLRLSASVSSIQAPTMLSEMPLDYTNSSAYVITASNGDVINAAAWTANGGLVEVAIAETTTELNVRLIGAADMTDIDGKAYTNFSLSIADPDTGNRYSTLRILGSGVAYTREKKRIRTGVPASMSATDVGTTIDNPFVSTPNDVARVGLRAARLYSGTAMTISGEVLSINRRGDTGQVVLPTYEQVQNALIAAIGVASPTYQQVQNYYTGLGLTTYEAIQNYWANYFADPNVDQVFGNVQGARIWDEGTHRWYRIRSANLTPSGISFDNAEDDLTYADYQQFRAGQTYAQVQAQLAGLTYRQVELIGMTNG